MTPAGRPVASRRKLLITGGLIVAGGAVGATVDRLFPARSSGPVPEPGTVTIYSGDDESDGAQRQRLREQWNALNPDHQFSFIDLGSDADKQYSAIREKLQSRDPEVDIVNLDIPWIAEFAAAGHLRPLSLPPDQGTGFLERPLQAGRQGDEWYALPFNTDAGLLYYRTDLVKTPPDTWDKLEDLTRDILSDGKVRDDNPELSAGIALQLGPDEAATVNLWELLLGLDANPYLDGEIEVDGNTAVRSALTRLRDYLWPQTGQAQIVLPESLSHGEGDSIAAFKEGRTIFMRNWPNAQRRFSGSEGDPVDVAPLPGGAVLGGQSLAISNYSAKPVAAQRIIEFLTSDRSQQLLFERGGFAATRELVYQDSDLVKKYPYARVLKNSLDSAGSRPDVKNYSRFSEVFRDEVRSALRQREVPDLTELQQALDGAITGG